MEDVTQSSEHAGATGRMVQEGLSSEYYSFGDYVSRERMLTFWYQLESVLSCRPETVLEVGLGSKVVSGVLREIGISLTTADVNDDLAPDHVVSVQELDTVFDADSFDVVLCGRVLHHIPFEEFDLALRQLARVARRHVVLTLPVDDLRFYVHTRLTSRPAKVRSLRLPTWLKRRLLRVMGMADEYYYRCWKIGSSAQTRLTLVERAVERHFDIVRSYGLPEDRSHHLFVLAKRAG